HCARSISLQRTTPWTAGVRPDGDERAPLVVVELRGMPGRLAVDQAIRPPRGDFDPLAHVHPFGGSVQNSNLEFVVDQTGVDAAALEFGVHAFGGEIGAADAKQLGSRLLAEDARSRYSRDAGDHA